MNTSLIRVGVCGAAGRMGREVLRAVSVQADMQLVMAVDIQSTETTVGDLIGVPELGSLPLESDLTRALQKSTPDVVVDFTIPSVALNNILAVTQHGVYSVVGTTGLTPEGLTQIEEALKSNDVSVLIAPNFAIGAVLMMKFAQEASRYFEHAEIIEMHHNQKVDAPSGTALRTAALMTENRPDFTQDNTEKEILTGSRGGKTDSNIHIHSVRLPGYVAHQEVIFGGTGQTLTIRHDSLDRTSFMPGVLHAIRHIRNHQGLIVGLEQLF